MVRRQRFAVEHIQSGDNAARLHSLDQRLLVNDRAARRVDQDRAGFHARNVRGADQTTRAVRQHKMNADGVGTRQQFLLGNHRGAGRLRLVRRHVLAPGEQVHVERACRSAPCASRAGRARSRPASCRRAREPTGTPSWNFPARMLASPAGIARAAEISSPSASSAVAASLLPPPMVLHTTTPRAVQAAVVQRGVARAGHPQHAQLRQAVDQRRRAAACARASTGRCRSRRAAAPRRPRCRMPWRRTRPRRAPATATSPRWFAPHPASRPAPLPLSYLPPSVGCQRVTRRSKAQAGVVVGTTEEADSPRRRRGAVKSSDASSEARNYILCVLCASAVHLPSLLPWMLNCQITPASLNASISSAGSPSQSP